MIERPSPNFDGRGGRPVSMVVLHYTGMESAEAALDRLCDPAAKVSAHYLLDEDGRAYRLVPEDKRAWHAGVSSWRGETNVNAASIGIELVNPGHEFGYRPFPRAQIDALAALLRGVVRRHGVLPQNVVGHSDVAPERKDDPGELFPWSALACRQLALATPEPVGDGVLDIAEACLLLNRIGYSVAIPDRTIIAFQRRFRQRLVDGGLDAETSGLLRALAAYSAGGTAASE